MKVNPYAERMIVKIEVRVSINASKVPCNCAVLTSFEKTLTKTNMKSINIIAIKTSPKRFLDDVNSFPASEEEI